MTMFCESERLLPAQVSRRCYENGYADLALACIGDAIDILLGRPAVIRYAVNYRGSPAPAHLVRRLLDETEAWLFREGEPGCRLRSPLPLARCCEIISAVHGIDFTPEYVRRRTLALVSRRGSCPAGWCAMIPRDEAA